MFTSLHPRAARPRPFARRAAGPLLGALVAAAAVGSAGALLLTASPAMAQQAPAPKFAVIDVRRAVLETEEGLRVQSRLKKLFDNRQVELDGKQRQLQQDKETLDKEAQSPKADKAVLQKKFENLQRNAAELQQTMVDYQREMTRKEQEMTTPILQSVIEAVKRIAAQDGYDMVLEKGSVPYFRADLELTDRAIQMVNSGQVGKVGPAPKGGAPAPAAPPAPKPAAPAPAPKK
jgi:outer membrane protein